VSGHPIPSAATDVWFAIEHLGLPPFTQSVMQACMPPPNGLDQRDGLDAAFGKLSVATLTRTRARLDVPHIAAAAATHGAHWSLVRNRQALDAILAGAVPHAAFGMAKRGCVHMRNFSEKDNIAAYVENWVRTKGKAKPAWAEVEAWWYKKVSEAFNAGREDPKSCDVRTIRWARTKLRALDDSDIAAMACVSAALLGLPSPLSAFDFLEFEPRIGQVTRCPLTAEVRRSVSPSPRRSVR